MYGDSQNNLELEKKIHLIQKLKTDNFRSDVLSLLIF